MRIAALVTLILTTGVGAYLFAVRAVDDGLRRPAVKVTRCPTVVVVGHPMLGLVALAAWVEFLVTSRAVYAWSAFAVLVLVALLGLVLLTRWLTGRGGRHARAERLPSHGVMLAHGAVAILTFVLVLLAAIKMGRR